MKIHRRDALCAAAVLLAGSRAWAQKLPADRPVHIVVPFAPGGTTDIIARQVSVKLSEVLSQSVVVDNRPGGAGTIAGALVAHAAPDGSTLLLGGLDLATGATLLGGHTSFDPPRDLSAIAPLTLGPVVLLVNPSKTRFDSLAELISAARAQPGTLTFGSAGNGNVTHLFGEIFKRSAKIDLRHVPYRGAAPAMTDLMGGQITMMFGGTASAREMVAAGQLKALAVTGAEPPAGLAGVPTFAQAGLPMPETELGAWTGLFGPAGMPEGVVTRLNQAVNTVLQMPELRRQLAQNGLVADPGSAAMLQARLASQTRTWAQVIRSAGITLE
ncbi:Bug family tripartite tricarboxylate transporter substrate binding protein [Variovorax sp. PBL-E5]|uniref:Bug family tripartite tricarboxylate transporter substrate binding protein n=1 Tax=Variovorax sp. PBL-E5 TaxID=434014 RepID=UPI001317DD71|nr:tripartite tricarboxylate transporter substrate binding protein [Variovorax sp. PBL-E5]VTU45174.1 Argininosuccinate lyase [Variovorax sp. PBL-E5]